MTSSRQEADRSIQLVEVESNRDEDACAKQDSGDGDGDDEPGFEGYSFAGCITGQLSVRKPNTIRIIEPTRHSSRVDTSLTVASLIFGRKSRVEHKIFRYSVRSRFQTFLWCTWVIGVVCGLLSSVGFIHTDFIWCSVLMLPLPIFVSQVLCVDLVKQVLFEFETYFVLYFQRLLLHYAWMLLKEKPEDWNKRWFFWLCFGPSMVIASFVDAYPSAYRKMFSTMFFTGLALVYGYWTFVLMFDYCDNLNDDAIWEFKGTKIHGFARTESVSTMFTLLAFCGRHLYVSIFRPDEFVVITSAVRTIRVEVRAQPIGDDAQTSYVRRQPRKSRFSLRDDKIADDVAGALSMTSPEQ